MESAQKSYIPRPNHTASTEKKKRPTGRVVTFKIAQAKGLKRQDEFKELDPIVIIYVEKMDPTKKGEEVQTILVEKARTPVQRKTRTPFWNFSCQATLADPTEYLVLFLCDWNPEVKQGYTKIGHIRLTLEDLESMQGGDDWIEVETIESQKGPEEDADPVLIQLQVHKVDDANAVVDRATSRLYGMFAKQEEKKRNARSQPPPGCTFTPKTKAALRSGGSDAKGIERMQQMYERAERTKNKHEQKRAEAQKNEIDACSFKPDTTKTKKRNSLKSSSFSNLYEDASRRKDKMKTKEALKTEGCTFQPAINRSRKGSASPRRTSGSTTPRHEMLYERSRKKLDTSNLSVNHELEGCTFKPDIRKSKRSHSAPKQRGNRYGNGESQQPLHERLYKEASTQREKLVASQEAAKLAELEELGPFSPQILKSSKDLAQRGKSKGALSTHERLYNEQKEHMKRRESLRKEHDKENSFRPKISKRSASVGRSRPNLNGQSIFERLNKEAEEIMSRKKRFEAAKSQAELSDCTFAPKLSDDTKRVAGNAAVDRSGTIWDRLNVDKSGTLELREQIKIQKELEDCTFAPSLPSKSRDDETSELDKSEVKPSTEPIHVRLHRDASTRKSMHDYHRKQSEQIEIQDCTFKPRVRKSGASPLRGGQKSAAEPIWDRLANEVNWKERGQLLERKKAEQEIANCSFHPGDLICVALCDYRKVNDVIDALSMLSLPYKQEINRGPRKSIDPGAVKSQFPRSPAKEGLSPATSPITSPTTAEKASDLDNYMATLTTKINEI
jgi:hypothetical protein